MKSLARFTVAATACLFASPARADLVDDVRLGTNLYLLSVTAISEGRSVVATRLLVPKDPGTLDIHTTPRAFGIDRDDPITLHGIAGTNTITWTLESTAVSPPFELGLGASVASVDGVLEVSASRRPGDDVPACEGPVCDYDVVLSVRPGGYIHVAGHGLFSLGSIDDYVEIPAGQLTGGLPRATLASMTVETPIRFCASATERWLTGIVRLATPARAGGEWVDLMTSDDDVSGFPSGVTVAGGARPATFAIPIPAGAEGAFTVSAAAGGVTTGRTVVVRAASDCGHVAGALGTFTVRDLIPRKLLGEALNGCLACADGAALNGRGDAVVTAKGAAFYYSPQSELVSLRGVFGGDQVSSIALNDLGQLTGTLVGAKGDRHGYLLSSLADPETLGVTEFDGLDPTAVSARGLATGPSTGGGTVFFNAGYVFAIKPALAGPTWVGFDGSGYAFFNDKGVVPAGLARFGGAGTDVVKGIGGDLVATYVGPYGDVVGGAFDGKGIEHAFALDAGSLAVRDLGVLAGYASSRATSVNAAGWVVGDAVDKQGNAGAFLATPGDGMVDLRALVDPAAGLTISRALTVTDAGEILVSGTREGAPGFYVISGL